MFLDQRLPGSHELHLPLSLPPSPPPSLTTSHPGRCSGYGSGGPDGLQDGGPVLRLQHSTSLLPHCELNISLAPTPASTCRLTAGRQHQADHEHIAFFKRLKKIGSKFENFFFKKNLFYVMLAVRDRQRADARI